MQKWVIAASAVSIALGVPLRQVRLYLTDRARLQLVRLLIEIKGADPNIRP